MIAIVIACLGCDKKCNGLFVRKTMQLFVCLRAHMYLIHLWHSLFSILEANVCMGKMKGFSAHFQWVAINDVIRYFIFENRWNIFITCLKTVSLYILTYVPDMKYLSICKYEMYMKSYLQKSLFLWWYSFHEGELCMLCYTCY